MKNILLVFAFISLGFSQALAADSASNSSVNVVLEIHSNPLQKNQMLLSTAFSVTDNGTFVTTQHSVTDCDTTFVLYNQKWVRVEKVVKSQDSDVAVLYTNLKTVPLKILSDDTPIFQVLITGFPGSNNEKYFSKTAYHLGSQEMVITGEFLGDTISDVWFVNDDDQIKNHTVGRYEGMSGGPLLSTNGFVTGMLVAENSNQPEIVSVRTKDIFNVLSQTDIENNKKANSIQYTETEMLKNNSITRIVCGNNIATRN